LVTGEEVIEFREGLRRELSRAVSVRGGRATLSSCFRAALPMTRKVHATSTSLNLKLREMLLLE
jgi:hypothetical protein